MRFQVKCSLSLLNRIVVVTRLLEDLCQVGTDDGGEGIQCVGFFRFCQSLFLSAGQRKIHGIPVMSGNVVVIEFQGALKLSVRSLPIAVKKVKQVSEGIVCLSGLIIQLECLLNL